MILRKVFIRIYRYLTFKGILNFDKADPDVSKWRNFINSMPAILDDIDRSYNRYKCRMYYFPIYYKVLANTAAFFALFFSVPIWFKQEQKYSHISKTSKGLLLVTAPDVSYHDIIPEVLEQRYGTLQECLKPERKKWHLNNDAKALLKQCVKRHPFSFYFNYLVFRELCMYSYLLDAYRPNAIAVYINERNIAGPILSSLCEVRGVDFVSFMHGEYIMQLLHAFMRFTWFYVWDEHYVRMFEDDLKCAPNQFIIYTPKKLQGLNTEGMHSESNKYFATYYFGAESKKRVQKVAEAFNALKSQGKVCKIRPHPRRSNITAITAAFEGFEIEDTNMVSIEESIASSEYIVALNSTVLSEAFYSGKKIVIDDYSDYEQYQNLKDRKYIMISKPHKLFSELIRSEPADTQVKEKY